MIRFLFKWSLQITGISLVGYHSLAPQKQADVDGALRSVLNSSRASYILFRSIYDYYYELSNISYNTDDYHKKRSQIHTRVANRILDLSYSNKGIYLKLGQYLGNLDKVMPWQFTEVLHVLQDSGPSIPYEQAKIVITQDLGIEPKQIFQKFNKNALASASLAQVHRATLKSNNKQVAVKIQFPFLRNQSKWDLWVLSKITNFCNYLMLRNNYRDVDLLKIFNCWTQSLIQELDFEREIVNAEVTRKYFKDNPYVHIPKMYPQYSSDRLIVMEYIDGIKVTETKKLQQAGFETKAVAKKLVSIFSDMIFKYGFVHCDAHPGNILIRKHPRGTNPKEHFQIVLLDHGLYRHLSPEFIQNLSNLWISLIQSNRKSVERYANNLNIGKHLEYLPIIFLYRTINSRKKLGGVMTPQEKKYIRQKDIANFDQVNNILQDLPPDLMFIIKAINLIASHNLKLGGTQRDRILKFTRASLWNVSGHSSFRYSCSLISLSIRLWIYENFYWLYRIIFGTLA